MHFWLCKKSKLCTCIFILLSYGLPHLLLLPPCPLPICCSVHLLSTCNIYVAQWDYWGEASPSVIYEFLTGTQSGLEINWPCIFSELFHGCPLSKTIFYPKKCIEQVSFHQKRTLRSQEPYSKLLFPECLHCQGLESTGQIHYKFLGLELHSSILMHYHGHLKQNCTLLKPLKSIGSNCV